MPLEEIWEEDDVITLAAERLAGQPAPDPSATAEVNPPSPVDVKVLEYVREMPSESPSKDMDSQGSRCEDEGFKTG